MSQYALLRSRELRRFALELLSSTDKAGVNFGLKFSQLRPAYRGQSFTISDADIETALRDLIADKLIEVQRDPILDEDLFKLTKRGRIFVAKNYPWDEVDKLTD